MTPLAILEATLGRGPAAITTLRGILSCWGIHRSRAQVLAMLMEMERGGVCQSVLTSSGWCWAVPVAVLEDDAAGGAS